jgi:TIR domain
MNRIANAVSPTTIFYSYAHEDESLRDELNKHLSLLKMQGRITDWYDRKIVPGTDWAHAIDKHLISASIILLLISPDFLASEYCYGIEMQRALERHAAGTACVIPIILRPIDWHNAPFSHLQCLPHNREPVTTWHNRDKAFLDIAQGIRATVESLQEEVSLLSHTPLNQSTNSFLLSASYHRRSFWLAPIFIAACGIVSAFIQRSWLTVVVTLLGAICVAFITTIIVKIWQRLGDTWIEQIVGQLSIHVEDFFSRHQKQYYEYLRYQHQYFDVKGLSTRNTFTLQMDQVFVDLAIVTTSTTKVTANPLQIGRNSREEERSIWEYLSSPPLAKQHFVIIGSPGSGKTTLLNHLALVLVTRKKLYYQYKLPYKTPFILFF